MQAIVQRVEKYLGEHDQKDPSVQHKAMVLMQTVDGLNPAVLFYWVYELLAPRKCGLYVTTTKDHPLPVNFSAGEELQKFERGDIHTLIVIGKLREGFDHRQVSVVAIARNVAPSSSVLFAQFVGRAVRKAHRDDPVTAMVVSHPKYKQKRNFDQLYQLAEQENSDDEWPEEDSIPNWLHIVWREILN